MSSFLTNVSKKFKEAPPATLLLLDLMVYLPTWNFSYHVILIFTIHIRIFIRQLILVNLATDRRHKSSNKWSDPVDFEKMSLPPCKLLVGVDFYILFR
jgi:hypothetical protein